ncbi:MAG: hypothetical protein RML46_10620 [Anaerolineae bacterium]|nr:hypothetical protein [Anaerolineae bacterium]MDW8069358.1 hypothetical protein [Anaerolineae bacterium]
MSVLRTETQKIHPADLSQTARALADIARELSRLSQVLAACAEESSPEAESLKAAQQTLTDLAGQLEEQTTDQEASGQGEQETARLRKAVLENLHRRGPALFPELAAATLSLPDEIRPVLWAMQQEGLVDIQTVRGWEMVFLTARGRDAVRNT